MYVSTSPKQQTITVFAAQSVDYGSMLYVLDNLLIRVGVAVGARKWTNGDLIQQSITGTGIVYLLIGDCKLQSAAHTFSIMPACGTSVMSMIYFRILKHFFE